MHSVQNKPGPLQALLNQLLAPNIKKASAINRDPLNKNHTTPRKTMNGDPMVAHSPANKF